MFKKFRKSILTALAAAIALPLILALYLLLPKNNAITVQAEEVLTVSTADELSAQLSANDTVTVQLTSDISSETTFTVSGVKTLDLNGYVVTLTGETGSVISVAEGAEFTLRDNEPTKENTVVDKTVYGGVITGGKSDNGGGVYVNSNAYFTMEGGNISGNTATGSNNDCGGGGVYVVGTFTMNGGTISGNTAQQHGGGVYSSGTFTMNDGTISGNSGDTSNGRGGGVYVFNTKFTMNGGTIGGSTDEDANKANRGGGVSVESHYDNPGGEFEMTDGTIIGNKAFGGGGVYLASNTVCTISGVSLINNIADGSSGGGISVDGSSNTTLNISNVEIRGCAANTGGGIFVNNGSTANITNVTITGCSNLTRDIYDDDNYYSGSAIYAFGMAAVNLTDGEISGNNDGAAIYWYGMPDNFVISGAPVIFGNQDGDLDVRNTKYKFENLEEGAKIGIMGTPSSADGVFTSGGAITEDTVKCFYSNDEKCITVQGGEASLSTDVHIYDEPVWSWADDYTSAEAAFTCNSCQHVETVTASGEDITNEDTTPATCTSTGETTYTATVTFNGAHKTDTKTKEIATLPHDYTNSTKYKSDGTLQHWKLCKDCTAEDTDHKENCGGGTATCTAKAVCSTCGNGYGGLDVNSHAWGEWTVSKEATCAEKGEQTRICSRDNAHKETSEINAKGHSYGEWTVTKEATETEEGEERRVCANDGTHFETRPIPKVVVPVHNGGLSAGALAGIVVACILAALLVLYIVCYFALYRRDILLKGKFFDAIYVPMNAIFGKKKQEEQNS